jgi:hypothetical protein
MYQVARHYGHYAHNVDYLIELGHDDYGTLCGGRHKALLFQDRDAARAAARKARRCCRGWNATKQRPSRPYPRVCFLAIETAY